MRTLRAVPQAMMRTLRASKARQLNTAAAASQLDMICTGSGERIAGWKFAAFRSPNADSQPDVDHVLVPAPLDGPPAIAEDESSTNPFVRYRGLLYSHRVAMARGMSDAQYVAMAEELNASLEATGGTGFAETPLLWNEKLNCFFKVDVRARQALPLLRCVCLASPPTLCFFFGSPSGRRSATSRSRTRRATWRT